LSSDFAARVSPSDRRLQLIGELSDAVRANQRATDMVDEVAGQILGIGRSDGRCLDILDQVGSASAGELARQLGLTTGAVTAMVDRLERAGYVQRVADPEDRRRVLVEATPHARAMGWELFGPLSERSGPLLARYSDEQLELLIEFHRLGCEFQEQHAEWLRSRLAERKQQAT
jgi:DNA-binding MarR family transcriptional regulator